MHVQAAGKELMDMLCKDDCLFYVCGDGAHMAKDVRATVIQLLQVHMLICYACILLLIWLKDVRATVIQLLQVCVSLTHTHTHTHTPT